MHFNALFVDANKLFAPWNWFPVIISHNEAAVVVVLQLYSCRLLLLPPVTLPTKESHYFQTALQTSPQTDTDGHSLSIAPRTFSLLLATVTYYYSWESIHREEHHHHLQLHRHSLGFGWSVGCLTDKGTNNKQEYLYSTIFYSARCCSSILWCACRSVAGQRLGITIANINVSEPVFLFPPPHTPPEPV